jgi:hypothetical protein
MFRTNYVSVARRGRLLALDFLRRKRAEDAGWHDWDPADSHLDVGNLTPAQLAAYLAKTAKPAPLG